MDGGRLRVRVLASTDVNEVPKRQELDDDLEAVKRRLLQRHELDIENSGAIDCETDSNGSEPLESDVDGESSSGSESEQDRDELPQTLQQHVSAIQEAQL